MDWLFSEIMRERNRTMSTYGVDRRRRSEANCIFRLWLFGRVFFCLLAIRSLELDSIVHMSQTNAIGRNRKNWRQRLIGCVNWNRPIDSVSSRFKEGFFVFYSFALICSSKQRQFFGWRKFPSDFNFTSTDRANSSQSHLATLTSHVSTLYRKSNVWCVHRSFE